MGFSLGGFLGAAITPANQVMAARAGAQAQANQRQQQLALQMFAMQRQADQLNMQRALQNSEINKNASLARSADALANYHNNGGPISVQWYQGDDGSQIPMVTRAPASYFRQGGPGLPSMPQGAPIQSAAFAPPTTNDLTSGLRGGPQQTGQGLPTPPVSPTTPPRITGKLGAPPPKPVAPVLGSPEYLAAQTALAKMRQQYAPTTNTYITGTNPQTNQPEIYAGSSRGAPSLTPMNVAKPQTGQGGLSQVRLASAQSGLSQMENSDQAMQPYEALLRSGKANLTGFDQFRARLAQSFMRDDPTGIAEQTAALADLNKVNPDLARYFRRGLEFAQGEQATTGRSSDFRTKLSDFLSTAGANPTPGMIDDIQNTRQAITVPIRKALGGTPVKYTPGAAGAIGGSSTPRASQQQQLWDAAVAKYGQAKVLQEYGPRPPE